MFLEIGFTAGKYIIVIALISLARSCGAAEADTITVLCNTVMFYVIVFLF